MSAAPKAYTIAQVPLTAHAFNAARTRAMPTLRSVPFFLTSIVDVAVSLNSNEATIYSYQGSDWAVESTLAEVGALQLGMILTS